MPSTPVPGRLPLDSRSPPKLATPPDDRAVEEPPIGKVLEQRGETFVQLRQKLPHRLKMLPVRVPPFVVDGDVGNPALDEPPGREAAPPKRVLPVALPEFVFLLGQVENSAGVSGDELVGFVFRLPLQKLDLRSSPGVGGAARRPVPRLKRAGLWRIQMSCDCPMHQDHPGARPLLQSRHCSIPGPQVLRV
jgi:hypothetical protein